jgi:cell wall-associated NlpC family hydrolase
VEFQEMAKITKLQKVEQQSRTWIGTKFKHQGRLKKNENNSGGVDCIGFIVGISKELGAKDKNNKLLHEYDRRDYSREPNGNLLKDVFEKFLQPVKDPQNLKPGYILLIRFVKHPQHTAVVGTHPNGELSMIHAYQPSGKVVEHLLTDHWKNKIVGVYKFKRGAF